MALVPPLNHWWHVTLHVSARGLTTAPMPVGDRHAEIELDVLEHRLRLRTSDGGDAGFALIGDSACAAFYRDLFRVLGELGVDVAIHPEPFDLGESPPFPEDTLHDAYDPDAVARYWRVLAATERVLARFAGSFVGKASPIHLFWHSFDLAYGRYSGRPATLPEGTDPITAEAYSHEVIAFGFWRATSAARRSPPSTPTRHPSPPGSRTGRWRATRRRGRTRARGRWPPSRTTPCAPRPTPTPPCSRSSRAPTPRAPARPAGTSPPSRTSH